MKTVKPSAELQTLLDNYNVIGGAIEYLLMEPDIPSGAEADLHKEAAVLFIETMQRQSDEYFEKLTNSWATRLFGWIIGLSRKREDYFQLTYDETKAEGEAISHGVFFGFELYSEHGFSPPDNERGVANRYWYAFSNPPYGMRGPIEERLQLFSDINNHLFGGLDADLDIYEWSTDWSNYFDDGNEWWGSYLWTIHVRSTNRWVALGASETD